MKIIALVIAALAACGHTEIEVGDLQEVLALPATPNPNLDLLFLIDNSPSMTDKQASLVANFPRMIDTIAMLPGGLPNLHIGVATSDMGTMGSHDAMPAPMVGSGPGMCEGLGNDGELQANSPALATGAKYIVDVSDGSGGRTTNYTGQLRDVFAQIATVGATGCGFEQHLAGIRRALMNPANAGFIRDEANLAVIILADEDDCSMSHATPLLAPPSAAMGPLDSFRCTHFGVTCDQGGTTPDEMLMVGAKSSCHASTTSPFLEDVAPFIDFLSNFKGDPLRVMVGAIVGAPSPLAIDLAPPPSGGSPVPHLALACTFTGMNGEEVAQPAVRIGQVVDAFPGRSALTTVCSDDLTLSLTSIGYSARQLIGDPCIDATLQDTSDAPGIQPLCVVSDDSSAGAVTVPACSGASGADCWRVIEDATLCGRSSQHLRLQIDRTAPPPAGMYTRMRCATM